MKNKFTDFKANYTSREHRLAEGADVDGKHLIKKKKKKKKTLLGDWLIVFRLGNYDSYPAIGCWPISLTTTG